MRILLTGASGFIGRELRRELEKEHEVVPFSRKFGRDVTNRRQVNQFVRDADVVIHLAAVSSHIKPWKVHYMITVKGTENIARACRDYGKRLVYMSSMAVKTKGFTNYSLAKKEQDRIVRETLEDFVGIRPSFVYDLENLKRLSSIVRFIPNKPILVNPVYRKTVIDAVVKAVEKGRGIYEVGDRSPVYLEDLARVLNLQPVKIPVLFFKVSKSILNIMNLFSEPLGVKVNGVIDYLVSDRVCDNKRAVRDLGIRPVDTIEKIKELKGGLLTANNHPQ